MLSIQAYALTSQLCYLEYIDVIKDSTAISFQLIRVFW